MVFKSDTPSTKEIQNVDAIDDDDSQRRNRPSVSLATMALRLVRRTGSETWVNQAGVPHITVLVGGHVEHYRLRLEPSSPSGLWIADLFYRMEGKALPSNATKDVLENLIAEARSSNRVFVSALRVARLGNRVFLDLCNSSWEVVQVTPEGWMVRSASDVPIRFTRTQLMLASPHPTQGGRVEALRPFFNCGEDGFRLVVAWILTALSGGREYPVLFLGGEAGSAKSTVTGYARALVDPNFASLRKTPKDEQNLFIAAKSGYVLTFDNLSTPPAWLADSLCAIALGTSQVYRALYTDDEEVSFTVASPIILNGITEQLTRADLADRAFSVTLHRIPQENMKPKDELDAAFAEAQPSIFGAFLDVISSALANLPGVKLDRYPRLAQTAKLMAAAEPALGWEPGTFANLLERSQKFVAESVTEGDPLLLSLQHLTEINGGQWSFAGTMTELRAQLVGFRPHSAPANWPPVANKLSGLLRRIASQLRLLGWTVVLDGRDGTRKNARCIRLSFSSTPPSFSLEEMEESPESYDRPKSCGGGLLGADD